MPNREYEPFQPTPYNPSAPASFTPTPGNFKPLQPFRYWCQKVLPLVYDDSLSYYELLCKVVDYLNKTMEDVETLHSDTDNLRTAYGELQADYNEKYGNMSEWINESYQELVTFVNTYFENLDVQEEINNKLDIMALDGTLAVIVAPYVPAATEAWLEEHITNPSSPPLDTSLTLATAAAPAKTVGDKALLYRTTINNTDYPSLFNIYENGFYYLNNSQTFEDEPISGATGTRMVICYTAASGTPTDNTYRYLVYMNYSQNKMFINYRNAGADGTWHDWKKININLDSTYTSADEPAPAKSIGDDALLCRGTITTSDYADLHNVYLNGFYYLAEGSFANQPDDSTAGNRILFVVASSSSGTPTVNTYKYLYFFNRTTNKIYSCVKSGSGWSSWTQLNLNLDNTLSSSTDAAPAKTVGDKGMLYRSTITNTDYPSLFDIYQNGFYYLNATDTFNDEPVSGVTGTRMVICYTAASGTPTANTYRYLVYFNYDTGEMYFTYRSAGSSGIWHDWKKIALTDTTLSVAGLGADAKTVGDKALLYRTTLNNTDYPSLFNVYQNGVYYLNTSQTFNDEPEVGSTGARLLICYTAASGTPSTNTYRYLVYINYSRNKLYVNYRNAGAGGVWHTWKCINDITNIVNHMNTIKIFKRVGCVGDSYTSGWTYKTSISDPVRTNEEFAWPHYLATKTGNDYVNLGASGTDVITWQSHTRGLPAAQTAGKCQAYIIGLGINDIAHELPVGTTADIGTDNETYYGGLSKIVRELKTISPGAIIFILNRPTTDVDYQPYNVAVETLCGIYHDSYNTHFIDLLSHISMFDDVNNH